MSEEIYVLIGECGNDGYCIVRAYRDHVEAEQQAAELNIWLDKNPILIPSFKIFDDEKLFHEFILADDKRTAEYPEPMVSYLANSIRKFSILKTTLL